MRSYFILCLLHVICITMEKSVVVGLTVGTDRFAAKCPADLASISQFDPKLLEKNNSDNAVWVAIYPSNTQLFPSGVGFGNNKSKTSEFVDLPVVMPTDDQMNSKIENTGGGSSAKPLIFAQEPIAVGRLRESKAASDTYIIDSLQCSLKKEDQDDSCDGGSEYIEALSICIDELLMSFLSRDKVRFHEALQCKATIHTSKAFEARGFVPMDKLCSEMTTHKSSIIAGMNSYAERVAAPEMSYAIRDRSMKILSLLGQLSEDGLNTNTVVDKQDDDEYDPWASVKKYL